MPTTNFVLNGQISNLSSDQSLAGSGKYFVATNPTPGTAIAYALQTGFSATANGMFAIANTDVSGGTNVYLDYLKLVQTATVPTGTLAMHFDVFNEVGLVTLTTAVATRTPVCVNSAYPVPSTVTVQSFAAGAATVPAAANTRRLQSIGVIQTGVAVAQDSYILQFGSGDAVGGTAGITAARAASPACITGQAAPVVVAPGTTSWINMWWVTQAANIPSFEFELAFIVI